MHHFADWFCRGDEHTNIDRDSKVTLEGPTNNLVQKNQRIDLIVSIFLNFIG